MAYAQASDIIARYPNRDLVQLTNEDPAQTAVNTALLQQALDDAAAEIDGYLETRFALPLIDPPAVLTRIACDIAIYRLQALRPLHDLEQARTRYRDAVEFLQNTAIGKVALGYAADGQPAPISTASETAAGSQAVFGRSNLKEF